MVRVCPQGHYVNPSGFAEGTSRPAKRGHKEHRHCYFEMRPSCVIVYRGLPFSSVHDIS